MCIVDDGLVRGNPDLLGRIVAAGCPILVLTEVEDLALEQGMLAAGAWDCFARGSLTASLLLKSIRRAVDHGRQMREISGTQAALSASEHRFRSLVRNAVHGILHTARDGTIVQANPALASMLGFASDADLLSRNITEFYVDAADHQRFASLADDDGRVRPVEVQWRRRDGKAFWVRLSGRALDGDGAAQGGIEALAEDVTEHRLLETQFRQAQKMEAVGRLAGGIAHDFNNLLTAMIGYAEILRDQVDPADPRRNSVDEVCRAAERASTLTRQLLAFSRKPIGQPQVLDLNEVVRGFQQMLRRLIGEHIELRTAPAASSSRVRVNPGQIEQVIMNLAINGRDAMATGGTLTIETANVELDDTYTRTHATVGAGPYVVLAVSDTGCGMSAEVKAHLFEPFFTTKAPGKGSGLGLATVYGIVQQNRGHIFVYSEPGSGSTFKIYLPRVDGEEPAAAGETATQPAAGGSETILLVEDEPAVRTLARDLLTQQGYRVMVRQPRPRGAGRRPRTRRGDRPRPHRRGDAGDGRARPRAAPVVDAPASARALHVRLHGPDGHADGPPGAVDVLPPEALHARRPVGRRPPRAGRAVGGARGSRLRAQGSGLRHGRTLQVASHKSRAVKPSRVLLQDQARERWQHELQPVEVSVRGDRL